MNIFTEDYYVDQVFSHLKTENLPSYQIEFVNCQFLNCDFERMDFSGYIFDNCQFEGCNLSLIKMNQTKLMKVFFSASKMEGVRFDTCDPFIVEIYFDDCRLRHCNFSELNLKKCRFENSTLTESDFYKTKLVEVSFKETVLTQTVFTDCDLSKSDFQGAIDFVINPNANILKKAKFSSNELAGLLRHLDIVIK